MKIGYAKTDQVLKLQSEALKSAGVEKIYKGALSGAKEDRTGLTAMLKRYARAIRSTFRGSIGSRFRRSI